jgi:hypothetical protein
LQHLQNQQTVKIEELTNLTVKREACLNRGYLNADYHYRDTNISANDFRLCKFVTLAFKLDLLTTLKTFLSTDIFKHQDPNVGSWDGIDSIISPYTTTLSLLALQRWLRVMLPLILITITLIVIWAAVTKSVNFTSGVASAQLPLYGDDKSRKAWKIFDKKR